MNFLTFWGLNDTAGCPAVIKIVGIRAAKDDYPEKVYYMTDYKNSLDYFTMDTSIKPYFKAYLNDNQLESLVGRYFMFNYEFVAYDPAHEDDYFDVEDNETIAVELYSVVEVESFRKQPLPGLV